MMAPKGNLQPELIESADEEDQLLTGKEEEEEIDEGDEEEEEIEEEEEEPKHGVAKRPAAQTKGATKAGHGKQHGILKKPSHCEGNGNGKMATPTGTKSENHKAPKSKDGGNANTKKGSRADAVEPNKNTTSKRKSMTEDEGTAAKKGKGDTEYTATGVLVEERRDIMKARRWQSLFDSNTLPVHAKEAYDQLVEENGGTHAIHSGLQISCHYIWACPIIRF